MPDITVSELIFYEVGDATELTLTVVVGEGQVGGSAADLPGCSVHRQGPDLENDEDDAPTRFTVRCPDGLRRKVLTCQTRVKDINPDTDRTSVTHTLEGGPRADSQTFSRVASTGGRVIYTISYVLV